MSARQPHIALVLTYQHRTLSRPIHGHAFRLYWTTKTKSMSMAMPMTKPNEKAKPRARAKKLSLGLQPCLSLRLIPRLRPSLGLARPAA